MTGADPLVDAHVHAARLTTLKPSWSGWAERFSGAHDWQSAYDAAGDPVPERLDALFEAEGVDRALLFCEYSPRATGIQRIEDNLPIVEYNPVRFRLVANVNPHLHHPVASEVERQLDLGAVALKLHPVHAGFRPDDRELYPAYQVCRERGVPVIIHSGTSTFPGARARFGHPDLMLDVLEDFPDVDVVLAHGGRGGWYDSAAFLAMSRDNVWIDLAGLPPRKLPEYYARFDLTRLATKWIFGTDWPGVPGPARNAAALADLGLPADVLRAVRSGNAAKVFPGLAV
ncbi:amidohydrolase family protein [Actinophytocola sp.]|uniref:amidohydrolase family protein n=1 Tax=Actinophytocola sp. TaxID=1872138 RepID=UPI002D7F3B57|nr:amidohydrolase family protein [Actinophytocola sp.]HET9140064.1 amidohydrolase family protein [Actinophytocola sp.]